MTCVWPRQEALLSRLRAGDSSTKTATTATTTNTKSADRERGAVIASVIILPVVMLAILLGIHFALVMHGRNVATAAAQDGVQAAQLQGATPSQGKNAAYNTLSLFGGIRNAQVDVRPGLNTVTVTVKGEVKSPLGAIFNTFEITRSGPVERFYLESERQ